MNEPVNETSVAVRQGGEVFVVPPANEAKTKLAAIRAFQDMVRSELKDGHDYGKIPGCGDKPTLLKPGGEKTLKLLELSDQYEIMDQIEDWNKGFFRYLIKCKAVHMGSGVLVSEGLGECNSFESKYRYRWIIQFKVPEGIDLTKLVSKTVVKKGTKQKLIFYRFDNDDIFSQVNTLLKMAKKRAMIDAALSAGRLSELFTQDIEDMGGQGDDGDPEYVNDNEGNIQTCPVHHIAMVNGQFGPYCPTKLEDGHWCKGKEPAASEPVKEKPTRKAKSGKSEPVTGQTETPPPILVEGTDPWFIYKIAKLNISDEGVLNYFDQNLHIEVKTEDTISTVIDRLNDDQRKLFAAAIKQKEKEAANKI